MPSFILHILNPFATYSNTSILHGAIPVTYMLLRNILEGVIRAVYGDLVLTGLSYIKKREKVASKRLRDIIEDERIKKYVPEKVLKKALDLWIKTSSYAHPLTRRGKEGLIPRAEDYISKHGGPPSYGVIPLPTTYEMSEADVEELHELAKIIREIKLVVEDMLSAWARAYIK